MSKKNTNTYKLHPLTQKLYIPKTFMGTNTFVKKEGISPDSTDYYIPHIHLVKHDHDPALHSNIFQQTIPVQRPAQRPAPTPASSLSPSPTRRPTQRPPQPRLQPQP